MINNKSRALLIFVLSVCTSVAQAGGIFEITVDFETDAEGNFLANGRAVTEAPAGNDDIDIFDSDGPSVRVPEGNGDQLIPVSNFFTITTTGDEHVGAAIFDSTPLFADPADGTSGPNAFPIPSGSGDISDEDLLVDLGNLLILQEDSNIDGPDTSRDADGNLIFNQPDDDTNEGSIFFNFFGACLLYTSPSPRDS